MLKNNSNITVVGTMSVTASHCGHHRPKPNELDSLPIGKERIAQPIENLEIDDINAFVDGLNNLNQVKQVLKQILYVIQIPKEEIRTFTINKGLKNDRLERRQNKNH